MHACVVIGAALRSLRRAPVRSALTTLGIVVGIAAIVATSSIGGGAKEAVQRALSRPESRVVHLSAQTPEPMTGRPVKALSRADGLRLDDYVAIQRHVVGASATSPQIYVPNVPVKARGLQVDVMLEGLDTAGFRTMSRQLLSGAFFSSIDVKRVDNVCLVSESLARALGLIERGIGGTILIRNVPFRVIGIVEDISGINSIFRFSDLRIYVPYSSLLRRLDGSAPIVIATQATRIEEIDTLQQQIDDIMERRRNSRRADFRTVNTFDSVKAYAETSLTVARLVAILGAVSLVVGGVGIMNIMLASVAERTREIGIRLAIGTRGRDILSQFLAEAGLLGLLGAVAGTALGCALSSFVAQLSDWPSSISYGTILCANLYGITLGLCFGFHPARVAARLRPVDALRSEG